MLARPNDLNDLPVIAACRTLLSARGAPPPLALARRLRASLGPQALFIYRACAPETTSMISLVIAACRTLFMYSVS